MVSSFYQIKEKDEVFFLVPFNRAFLAFSDVESKYLDWFNDPDVTRHNSHGLFPYTKKKKEDFLNSLDDATDKVVLAIVHAIKYNDGSIKYIHVGNASIQSINWVNRSGELAIIIGETEYHGQGLGTAVCKKILEHGFNKLNLHRIWTGTSNTNFGMQKTATNIGMRAEGVFRDGMFLHGKYENICLYSILENEWRDK